MEMSNLIVSDGVAIRILLASLLSWHSQKLDIKNRKISLETYLLSLE